MLHGLSVRIQTSALSTYLSTITKASHCMMVSHAWITAIKRWFNVAMASGNSVMKIMPSALAAPTRTVLNVYLGVRVWESCVGVRVWESCVGVKTKNKKGESGDR